MAAAAHQSFRLTWADLAGNLDEGSEISNRTLFKLAFNEYKKNENPFAARVFCLLLEKNKQLLAEKKFLESTDDGKEMSLEGSFLFDLICPASPDNSFAEVLVERAFEIASQLNSFAERVRTLSPTEKEEYMIAHSSDGSDEYSEDFLKSWGIIPFDHFEGIFPDAHRLYQAAIVSIVKIMSALRECHGINAAAAASTEGGAALTFAVQESAAPGPCGSDLAPGSC